MELVLVIVFTHLTFLSFPTISANLLPRLTPPPLARSHGFHHASGTTRLSDYSPGIASHFASLIGLLIPVPPGNRTSSPEVTHCSSVPCRPQTPCYRGRMSSAFASYTQARPLPLLADRFIFGVAPRLRPGTSPHALRIPPHGGHPALRSTTSWWLQVCLGRIRLSPSCPCRHLHTFHLSPASEALPPLSDMAPLIRAPEGLEPS